jgi:hypothetical protein
MAIADGVMGYCAMVDAMVLVRLPNSSNLTANE